MSPSLKRNLWIVGSVVFAVLLIDQIIKVWVKTTFQYYDEPTPVFGNWFQMIYIENQGMAFGTTFGSSMWAKLGLSIFRILAIIGIAYYWWKQAKKGMRTELLIAIGFIFAGATGNLIDSMFYDFIFPYDGCIAFNHLEGSGVYTDCGWLGKQETRHTGFLLGNVVDMFQFNMTWPQWVPWVGGSEVFPAIWNIADGSITIGVVMMIFRQRSFFASRDPFTPKAQQQFLREMESLRRVGVIGGAVVLLLSILLLLKVLIVPAGYETMAFYALVAIYLICLFVAARLSHLQHRSRLLWVILALILPIPAVIVLALLKSKAPLSLVTEEQADEELPVSE